MRPKPPAFRCRASCGARRRAATCPITCRAGASFIPLRPAARAAAAQNARRSARMSPRRWMWCRGNCSSPNTCGRSSAAGPARRSPQPPAPFHAISRGFAGPSLLAMILVDKYANHQPLNRQSEQFAREGVELSVSTMADHVGACAAALMPLYELIKAHVFAAERIHGDDTTVPVLAKVKTRTGRIWTYVRDDRPFGGQAPPACVFFYSPDRGSIHPEQHLSGYCGILQADAYAGFNRLYAA